MTVTFVDPLDIACRAFGDPDLAVQATKNYRLADFELPKGWTKLGSGCYRVVWLGPDGVAYKVNSGDGLYNTEEVVRWRMLWKHPQWRNVAPLHNAFEVPGRRDVVVAAEYVPGDRPSRERDQYGHLYRAARDQMLAAAGHIGISDTHEGNWRFRTNGRPCLIDAAGWGRSRSPQELPTTEGCTVCNPNHYQNNR